jgi:hypothetical protein
MKLQVQHIQSGDTFTIAEGGSLPYLIGPVKFRLVDVPAFQSLDNTEGGGATTTDTEWTLIDQMPTPRQAAAYVNLPGEAGKPQSPARLAYEILSRTSATLPKLGLVSEIEDGKLPGDVIALSRALGVDHLRLWVNDNWAAGQPIGFNRQFLRNCHAAGIETRLTIARVGPPQRAFQAEASAVETVAFLQAGGIDRSRVMLSWGNEPNLIVGGKPFYFEGTPQEFARAANATNKIFRDAGYRTILAGPTHTQAAQWWRDVRPVIDWNLVDMIDVVHAYGGSSLEHHLRVDEAVNELIGINKPMTMCEFGHHASAANTAKILPSTFERYRGRNFHSLSYFIGREPATKGPAGWNYLIDRVGNRSPLMVEAFKSMRSMYE